MCDGILLTIGEDGVAREYDDTWDIVIHCESKEEHDAVIKRLTVLESHWIPFEVRELTDEEREEHPDWEWILDGDIPEDGQEILVSRGKWVITDTFIADGECYLDGGWEIEKGMAWMPLPEPYKEEGGEE